jgi:uncharacterized protein YajQ (UPF0234 family)
MPSFDIVSEFDFQEVRNAVDQAQKEVGQRYDFKGTDSSIELADDSITINADVEQRLKAVVSLLEDKFIKRKLSQKILDAQKLEEAAGGRVRQVIKLKKGIEQDKAKQIGKTIKSLDLKGVQHQIQGDQIRISAKKRDQLQTVIAYLRDNEHDLPLQFNNFRD